MRTLWTIVAVLALVNVLALGGLVGWLNMTGRLSGERVLAVKAVFSPTVEEEKAAKAEAEAASKRTEEERARADKMAQPPTTAAERIAEDQFRDEQAAQVRLRLQQDLMNLRGELDRRVADLDAREKKLTADRAAFEAERKVLAERGMTEQFKAALATLEGQKPKDAKAVLRAMMVAAPAAAGNAPMAVGGGGGEGGGVDRAVSYLAKMDEGKRTKVIAEFVKDDPALAADLLERLRTMGAGGAGTGPAGEAGPPSSSEQTQAAAHDAGTPGSPGTPGHGGRGP